MIWANVWLLWRREMVDQLRDRRTLFTVVVLPLLLYPLLGISLIQITQFFRERPSSVVLYGASRLPDRPALLNGDKIDALWAPANEYRLIELQVEPDLPPDWDQAGPTEPSPTAPGDPAPLSRLMQLEVERRKADLAVVVVAAPQLAQAQASQCRPAIEAPEIWVFVNSARDASASAAVRVDQILKRWRAGLVEQAFLQQEIDPRVLQPVVIRTHELAPPRSQRIAIWSKILPLVIVLWCLTGAFYPAVDLCAGEKERGTFETILSSPANRAEIAWGKLLTVVSFSLATALLNLISLTLTTLFVAKRMALAGGWGLGSLGLPPWSSLLWIPLASIPIAFFLSAVSLAAAAFARSSKEGQYYLVPLIMVSLPLVMLTMVPTAQLELGTSLIPVTGMMLFLRGLIEGQYAAVLPYVGPVFCVMIICVWASVRWVIFQFNSEAVLFRASERFGVGLWIRRMLQERGAVPTVGQAALCFIVIVMAKFFIGFSLSLPSNWGEWTLQTVVVLTAAIAMPALLMALVLTKQPLRALKLTRCRSSHLAAAALLAIALHPAFTWLSQLVMAVYPASEGLQQMNDWMGHLVGQAPSVWALLIVVAVIPAITEEAAFRGFILSGFQRLRNSGGAIVLSAVCFGAAHSVIQQSAMTFFIGMVLGVIAVRTGSLVPCILFHAVHNALSILISSHSPVAWDRIWPIYRASSGSGGLEYAWLPAAGMTILGAALLVWIWRQHNVLVDGADHPHPLPAEGIRRQSVLQWIRGLALATRSRQ